jgi:uncharacterized protein (DUF305 family)
MKRHALAWLAFGALTAGCSPGERAPQRGEGTPGREREPGAAEGQPAGTPDQHRMMQGMIDADFVPMMVAHHEQGIEMARLEEANGSSGEVKALAARIRQSQEREVAELVAHGSRVMGSRDPSARAQRDQMMSRQGRDAMDRLRSVSGPALDKAFLQEMARHHQMAIHMAQMTTFQDGDLKTFSDRMVADQQRELEEMKGLEGVRAE